MQPSLDMAVAGAPMRVERGRPLIIRVGKHLRGAFDRLIASSSLVSNDPVLDMRDFAWTQALRANWRAIRDEAVAVALRGHASPSLAIISPDHRAIAEIGKWRSFFLWGYGYRIDDNADRCPLTTALVEGSPALTPLSSRSLHPARTSPRIAA